MIINPQFYFRAKPSDWKTNPANNHYIYGFYYAVTDNYIQLPHLQKIRKVKSYYKKLSTLTSILSVDVPDVMIPNTIYYGKTTQSSI